MCFYTYIDFLLDFEFSRQKLSKFNYFHFLIILFLIKITILGAKIQIIQVIFSLKHSQKSWHFRIKIQIQNFEFSWKWKILWAFNLNAIFLFSLILSVQSQLNDELTSPASTTESTLAKNSMMNLALSPIENDLLGMNIKLGGENRYNIHELPNNDGKIFSFFIQKTTTKMRDFAN